MIPLFAYAILCVRVRVRVRYADLLALLIARCEGRVCSMVFGERTCHKANEVAERDVKDELAACVQKCNNDLVLDFKIYRAGTCACESVQCGENNFCHV